MQRDQVATAEEVVERRGLGGMERGVVNKEIDAEPAQPRGHVLADAAKSDKTNRLPGQLLRRVQARAVPLTASNRLVELWHPSKEREHETHGVIGDGLFIGPWRRRDLNPSIGCGFDSDRINSYSDPRDDSQIRGPVQHIGGEGIGRHNRAYDAIEESD